MKELWPMIASVLGVFTIMAMGALCRRRNWLDQQSDHSLANLITKVLLPAYFLSRILSGPQLESVTSAWQPPLFGFAMTTVGFGLGFLFARTFGERVGLRGESQQRAFALCVGICNYGYVPLPLAERFYPDAVVPLILHNVGVDLALWSVGVALISGSKDKGWARVLLSPPFVAVILACVLKATIDVAQIPTEIMFVATQLGNCAIPIGLLLSGAITMDFLSDVSWMRSTAIPLSAIAIRQCVLPVVMLAVAYVLSLGTSMQEVVVLQAAMPAAVFPIVLVRLYNRDTTTAIQVILWTSFAGVVLIPLWLLLGSLVFSL